MSGEHGKSILTLPKFKVCKKIKINLLKIYNHQINKIRQLLNNSNVVINDSKNIMKHHKMRSTVFHLWHLNKIHWKLNYYAADQWNQMIFRIRSDQTSDQIRLRTSCFLFRSRRRSDQRWTASCSSSRSPHIFEPWKKSHEKKKKH
jgi:hypothetical protein